MMKSTYLSRALALMLASVAPVVLAGPIATIDGQYDSASYDTPSLIFHNTSAYTFDNATLVLTGYQGINNGLSETLTIASIPLGDSTLVWTSSDGGDLAPSSDTGSVGTFYVNDYDDSKGGPGPCPANPVNSGLCAQVGNFYVTFTATWNGESIYSQFSPTNNATGGFVGWEGLDPAGLSEDPNYDVHNGTLNGTMAYIYAGVPGNFDPNGNAPEPGTLSLLGLGALAARFGLRKKSTV